MKANEFMVGDLVYSTFCDKPCKVVGIEQYESEYAVVKVTNVSGAKDITSLTPIPLTPEILEKNGFETDDGAHFFIQGQDNILELLLVELPFDGYTFDIVRTERTINKCNQRCYIDRFFASIDYVHQLQHALRLCGIEKEIVL